MTIRKIVLVVEYDGTDYFGFQLQSGQPTIQGEIEEALRRLTGERRRVMAASRTDTGVHAEGQIVSFQTGSEVPLKAFVNGLNYYLAKDIAVRKAYRMTETLNVRRDAISREYDYYMLNRGTRSPLKRWTYEVVPGELKTELMHEASQVLRGEHDFASFVPESEMDVRSTVREVYRTGIERQGEAVVFNIAANSFLRHQVRNMVGALIRVGKQKMTVGEFKGILEAKTPGLAGPRASACGLCLKRVNYPVSLRELSEETVNEDL
ncbi:tRNA pseudouridine(38-40) synthase TruA [Chloroflexota bacterium]